MATNLEPQETQEYCIFRAHYDRLYHTIQDPLTLATRLFASNIITSAVREQMSAMGRSRLDNNGALLTAVGTQIQTNPNTLYLFLSALDEDPPMQSLAENIRGKKCCVIPILCLHLSFSLYSLSQEPGGGTCNKNTSLRAAC